MEEFRCGTCDKLLAKGEVVTLSIKCPRCGAINHLRATSPNLEGRRASLAEDSDGQGKALPSPSAQRVHPAG